MTHGTETPGVASRPRRILLVEINADRGFGHYPVVFGELGTALSELGYEVEALTRKGWYFAGDPAFAPLTIRRFDKRAARSWRWATRLRNIPPRAFGVRLMVIVKAVVLMNIANREVRRGSFTDVIVTSGLDPLVAALFAKRGRWLSYQFHAPPDPGTGSARSVGQRIVAGVDRSVEKLSAAAAKRRREQHLRIAASVPANAEAWAAVAPWLEPVTVPFIAARPREPIPDAREQLDLPADVPLALLFGGHPKKDSEIVWRAFAQIPEWRLVIGGSSGELPASDAYRKWASGQDELVAEPSLFDGFADEATRARLYAAADLVIVSFKPDTVSDSGNLVDAIAWGRVVVCSDGCPSAEIVRRHRLGTVFEPGNVDSLVAAIRNCPRQPDPDGLRAARAELGAHAVAQRNLDALDSVAIAPRSPA